MELKKLPYDLTICKLSNTSDINLNTEFYFIGKTDGGDVRNEAIRNL